ncbi:MAG TPA: RNA polymerase sigma factor [Thermoanaerobaculia bacterium]|nr:RNA polymerase sigma factor [Thermoanaerobaculia bacterium]
MAETLDTTVRQDDVDDYERLRAELVRSVSRICPPWLASRADDLVQVALLRVLEVRRKSEANAQISTSYLRKTAYSALIDEIRRCRRRREISLERDDGEIEPEAERRSPNPDPEESSAGHEAGRAIRDCLARMVRPRRLAVALHLQGHSVPEIGHLMSWTPKKADNLVYRGMADLRECLGLKGVRP